MTVSKTTTTLDKAEAFRKAKLESTGDARFGIYEVVDFADSLTAELQKENARLEKLVEWTAEVLLQHMNDEDYEASIAGIYAKLTESVLNPPKGGAVKKGRSQEKQ